jgi:fibronectin-binding autotransporter adhesin
MKNNALMTLPAAIAAVLAASIAHAAPLYWDGATPAGAPGGGAGNWDHSLSGNTANWDTSLSGGDLAWVNADLATAVFGGTAGTVTLNEDISVGGLTFNTTGYTITGVTNSRTLTFGGATNVILLNSIATANINGAVAGNHVILATSNPATAGNVNFNNATAGGWSGATTVRAGMTLTVDGSVLNRNLLNTSGVTLNGGAIAFSNIANNGNAPADRIHDAADWTVNSGTFTWGSSNNGGTYAETIGTVTVNRGQMNFVLRGDLGSGSQALTLGTSGVGLARNGTATITFSNTNTALNSLIAAGADVIRVNGVTTSTPANQIIGPWATVGAAAGTQNDFARYVSDGTHGYVVAANIASTAETAWVNSTTDSWTLNPGASLVLSGNRQTSALRFIGASAALNLGNYDLQTNGVLFSGTNAMSLVSGGTGTLTTFSGGGNLYLTAGQQNHTVSAPINDNGGAVTVVIGNAAGRTLTLGSTTSNFSGGIVLNGGTLATTSDANLGNGGGITVNGTAMWNAGSNITLTYHRSLTVNEGAVLSLASGNAGKIITGVLSGSGTIINTATTGISFTNTGNTFTGTVNNGYQMDFASLGDGGTVNLVGSNSTFNWIGGAKTFSNRVFAIQSASTEPDINNNGTGALVIEQDLAITGAAGARTLNLGGANTARNTFAGDIANGTDGGTSVVSLTKRGSGTWILSGTNTHSGDTGFGGAQSGGTLVLQGAASASPNSTFSLSEGSMLALRDDTAGTVTFGAPMQVNLTSQQTSARAISNINVNRISTGSNSTLALGKLNYAGIADNRAAGATVNITGGNGYALQFGGIDLDWGLNGTQNLNPTTASVTVTGTVQHINGRPVTGTLVQNQAVTTAGMGFVLDGTATGNLISGAIKNAADFDDLSNANALPLTLTKQGAGVWTLSGANTFTGATTITAGKLLIGGTGSLAAGSTVTVSGGALGGTGAVNGPVGLTTAGGIDLRDNAVGTLTLGGTLGSTGAAGANNFHFDLGNGTGTSDRLSVAAATTVANPGAAVININQLGGAAGRMATTYTLIGGAGALSGGDFANFSLATTAAFGQTYALTNTSDDLQLVATNVTGATPAAFWAGGGNNWSSTANWRASPAGDDAVAGAPDYQTNVSFSTTTPTPANLTTNVLDVDFNINSLTFTSASGNVTIGGTRMLTIEAANANGNTAGNGIDSQKTSGTNTISAKVGLGSTQTWTVAAGGTLAVSGAITDFGGGHGLTKAGGGTLTLSGTNTYSGGTTINAGTVNITSHAQLGGLGTSITFGGSATLNGTADSTFGTLTVSTGTATFGNNTYTFTSTTGGGGITFNGANNSVKVLDLGNAIGLTGTLQNNIGGHGSNAPGKVIQFTALADTPGTFLRFGGGDGNSQQAARFRLYGDAGALTFANRQISFLAKTSGSISFDRAILQNDNSNPENKWVINTDLANTTDRAHFFELRGTNTGANEFAGAIVNSTNGGHALSLNKVDAGTWILSNTANSYTGATAISGGTLVVSTLADAGADSSIGAFATPGAAGLVLSGGTLLYTGGSVTTNRGFTQSAGSGLNMGGSGAAALTLGDVSVSGNGTVLTLTGTAGSSVTISGAVNNTTTASNGWTIDPRIDLTISGVMSGTGGFSRRNGAGHVTLSNDNNSFTGLVNANASAGSGALFFTSIADYGANSALGRGTAGVAIVIGGNQGGAAPLTYIGVGAQTSNRQFDLGANASINNNGGGTLTFTGLAADSDKFIRANQTSGARTLTLGGTYTGGANLISGKIENNGGTATVAIAKDGLGHWILSGANTYTGSTVVNAGTLQFTRMESLYNNTPASWTASSINVKAGATLALNVDSAGTAGFDNLSMDTLLAGISVAGSATAGLQAGAVIGIDTSTAGGGTFTQGDVFANSTGANGGTLGLTKLGTGTLVLNNWNSYTGATTVSGGTLRVDGATFETGLVTVSATATLGGSGLTGAVTVQNGGTLAPGSSIESLGVASAGFDAGSTFAYEYQTALFDGTPEVSADLVYATGALNIAPGALLTLTDLGTSTALAVGSKLTLISYTGDTPSGVFTFAGSPLSDGDIKTIGANLWQFKYADTSGGDNFSTDQIGATKFFTMTVAVPEAGTAGLLTFGLLLLRRLRRRL